MNDTQKELKILVVNGPNLNMLGKREPEIYGSDTLDSINRQIIDFGAANKMTIDTWQSNTEGEIVTRLQEAMGKYDGLVINPAAYTHTSVAVRDAVSLLDFPVIEVHLSNIYKREDFRHKSFISGVATGQIAGFGANGYKLALQAIRDMY